MNSAVLVGRLLREGRASFERARGLLEHRQPTSTFASSFRASDRAEQIHIPRLRPEAKFDVRHHTTIPNGIGLQSISGFMEKKETSANQQLAECREEVAAVKQDLAEVKRCCIIR